MVCDSASFIGVVFLGGSQAVLLAIAEGKDIRAAYSLVPEMQKDEEVKGCNLNPIHQQTLKIYAGNIQLP